MSSSRTVRVTPVITLVAYTANDQVGTLQTIPLTDTDKGAELKTLTVIDKAAQAAQLDIFLFDQDPLQTSVDNAAFAVPAASWRDKALGHVAVAAADYAATASGARVATKQVLLSLVSAALDASGNRSGKLYALVVTRGTPTYAAVDDLSFVYGIVD